ncbi:hypothetical protein GGX14DRAFT_351877, partial [Mycena pura]
FTSPTGSIGFTGGQSATIQWMDDGKPPLLSAYGPSILSIYTGNAQQQTSLQTINPSIDPNAANSFPFTVDPTIGPNGSEYFIRLQSLSAKDPNDPTGVLPLLAFSHVFTLSGMTGTFNASVQSQIDGQSTAPIGGGAPAAAPTPSAAATSSGLPKTSAGGSGSATAKGAAASASGKSAAVSNFGASHSLWLGVVTGVVGAFVGAALL